MRNILLILFILTAISHGARVGSLGRNDEVTVPSELNYTVVSNAAVSAVVNGTNTGAIAIVGEDGEAFNLSTTADITLSSEGGSGTINIDGTLSLDPENIPTDELYVGNIGYNDTRYLQVNDGITTNFTIYGTLASGSGVTTNSLVFINGLLYAYAYGEEAVVTLGTYPDMDTSSYPSVSLASFDAFDPPVDETTPNASAPAVAEYTRSSKEGDTMALTVENMPTAFVAYGIGVTNAQTLTLQSGRETAVTLAGSLPSDEMYLMWPTNHFGYGEPVAINKTDAWWVGSDLVSTGDTFSVYGRNLKMGSGVTKLWCEEEAEWLTSTDNNPYRAEFSVPSTWTNGTKTIWAHNGKGREYGWAESLTLTVEAITDWTAGTTNTVGAFTLAAINTAISASSAGDTVYFPDGTYELSGSMVCTKDDIRFAGQSMGAVITTASGFPAGAELLDMTGRGNVHFDTLTFDTGIHMSDITPFFRFDTVTGCSFSDVKFTSVSHPSVIRDDSNAFEFHHSDGLSFTDCEFRTASLLNFAHTDQLFITGCDFYMRNECSIVINHGRGMEASITDCTFQNETGVWPDGCGIGRTYHVACQNGADIGRVSDTYYGGNMVTDMSLDTEDTSDVNQSELYLIDIIPVQFRGTNAVATANTIYFASGIPALYDYTKATVTVVDGRGLGQSRDVIGYDEGTDIITVSPDWLVQPDSTSIISVGAFPTRNVVYDNVLDGWTVDSNTYKKNSIGVYLYGAAVDNVIENNTFTDLREAVSIVTLTGSGDETRPMFFNLVSSNNISGTVHGMKLQNGESGDNTTGIIYDPTFIGNVYRNIVIAGTYKCSLDFRERNSTSYTIGLQVLQNISMTNSGYKGDVFYEGHSYDTAQTGVTENQFWINCTADGVSYPGDEAH